MLNRLLLVLGLAISVGVRAADSATATAAGEPAAGTAIVFPGDGAVMVYVPAGDFTMGLDVSEVEKVAKDLGKKPENLWAWEAFPKRRESLPGYFIDKHEVTVKRWEAYTKATGYACKSKETSRHFGKLEDALLPAAEMTWAEAKAYGVWAGKSLPSEAQWEKAARGTDGRLYPWGNDGPTLDRGHFGEPGKQPPLYVKVGQYPKGASPCGALDMLGNQYEWTSDWMKPYPNNPEAAKMQVGAEPKYVVLRGGSWYHGWVSFYAPKRFGFEAGETYYHVGFRTVWTPPVGYFTSEAFKKARAAYDALVAAKAEEH